MEQLTLLDTPAIHQPGVVYWMTDGYLIKCGYTSRGIRQRSGELRATVIAFQPGNRKTERAYQDRFKPWCVGGEWFRLPDEPQALSELRILLTEWGGHRALAILDSVIVANLRGRSAA